MYGTREKIKVYQDIDSGQHATADLELLKVASPNNLVIATASRNPKRYHKEILWQLLDYRTSEEIRQNRRFMSEPIAPETPETDVDPIAPVDVDSISPVLDEKAEALEQKEAELNDREEDLNSKETDLEEKETELSDKEDELSEKEKELQTQVAQADKKKAKPSKKKKSIKTSTGVTSKTKTSAPRP